jgi:ABC-type amino acid transport substrate-binding protein
MLTLQKLCALAAAMAAMTVVALSSSDGALAQSATQSTLDQVISSKKLRVGIIMSLPPFGM